MEPKAFGGEAPGGGFRGAAPPGAGVRGRKPLGATLRRWLSALALLGITLGSGIAVAVPAQAATARQPILFVHGYDSNGSTWNTMVANFTAAGYTSAELFAISYNTRQSNATTAAELGGIVTDIQASSGWATIDVISHSMGGLSSRHYLRNLGGTAAIDEWVSLGGPNHGTKTARFCFDTSCREMRPRSPFLTELNTGDETPGTVRYGTWASPCDIVILPNNSVPLAGARNTRTACLGHSDLQNDATVFGQVLTFVTG